MRVIEDNFNKEKFNKTENIYTCNNCMSKVDVDDDDLQVGEFGNYYYVCPCCGEKTYLDSGIELNKDNIRFPQHYCSTASGIDISDDKIDKMVKKCIERIEKIDSNFSYTATGNTFVLVTREYEDVEDGYNTDGYNIYVSKEYYESYVSKNETDVVTLVDGNGKTIFSARSMKNE